MLPGLPQIDDAPFQDLFKKLVAQITTPGPAPDFALIAEAMRYKKVGGCFGPHNRLY